ncbi:SPFH domain-containing protein [uncultured Adlercreutzia sp.]|uniref:SPFH domain-containing protein n=1 Tax=uncultured Adlercreutzia sp. TaxID=875803 RepID=UPI0025D94024|nr:SPFH domain-containing protein [uncultured Adlercreutzia sp.]
MDEIRCDEQDYLIWQWRPKGADLNRSSRATAIRWGSSLHVREGSVAVFFYQQEDGVLQEYIEGPANAILETSNLPVIASVVGAAYDGGTPFQAEIFFINMAQIVQVQFGVPFFDVYDPRFMDFGVPTAVRGVLTFRISDFKKFIQLHRLQEFTLEHFKRQVKEAIIRYVKKAVANIPFDCNIPLVQIERRIDEVSDAVLVDVRRRLSDDFGVEVSGLDISSIEVDKSSEGYKQLKAVTLDIQTQTTQAQAQVSIRNLEDQQRINAQNLEETLRIQREETQYAQRKQTQSANFPAFQLETQANVGIAGAEALGQMGASASMGGGGGDGMNPGAMMAGLAMGGAIGQNMAGVMGGMMSNVQNSAIGQTPPPVPAVAYNVAVNGQATGPYDLATLRQMAAYGGFERDSLVWKTGMPTWEKAGAIQELQGVFETGSPSAPDGMPPVPPAL